MSRQIRQLLVGLVALPLSVVPFVAYGTYTAEGRLVRDRVIVALMPPKVPTLSAAEVTAARSAAPRYRDGVTVLAYHGVGSTSSGEGDFVVTPGRFGSHLATLRAAGFHAVTAPQVAAAFDGGPPLPTNAILITFDDGRTDAMLWADPLLEQADMRATMFVITSAAEKPGLYYASWSELRKASRSGRWDLQSHTARLHHEQRVAGGESLPALTSLAPGESLVAYRKRVRDDLAEASAAIEKNTGERPVAFAYPFGAYGAERTNSKAIRRILRDELARQYDLAFEQDEQDTLPLVTSTQNRLELRRLEVGNWTADELLRRIGAMAARTATARPEDAPVTEEPADVDGDEVAPPTMPPVEQSVATAVDAVRSLVAPVTSVAPVPSPMLPPVPQALPPATAPVPLPTTTTTVPRTTTTTTPVPRATSPTSPTIIAVPPPPTTTTEPAPTTTTPPPTEPAPTPEPTPTPTTTPCGNQGRGRGRC